MSSMLSSVETQTNIAGQNRFQMLMFMIGNQPYGINVFKVREVVRDIPNIVALPQRHPYTLGVVTMRGDSMPLIDLRYVLNNRPTNDPSKGTILVTEYNRKQQAFLVDHVEAIETVHWEQISPTPKSSQSVFITGVCHLQDKLILIPDVEQILEQIAPQPVATKSTHELAFEQAGGDILIADDSSVARRQIVRAFADMPFNLVVVNDGAQALKKAEELSQKGTLRLILSDIEMPEMDGYTLTAECRQRPAMAELPIVLHSSLSGEFNNALIDRVGASAFVAKFSGEELLDAVSQFL